METSVILWVRDLATLGTGFFSFVCRGETGWGFISVSSHGPDANEKQKTQEHQTPLYTPYIHIFLHSNIPNSTVVGHPAMCLGFPFFPVHKAEYYSPQLSAPWAEQNPNAQNCLRDRSQHLAHSKPMNRSIATGCHMPGKMPGTFGVEVRALREKQEASRAFILITDESRAGKSCHTYCKVYKILAQSLLHI